MKPEELAQHLERVGVGRKEFCDRLGVTEASFSFWLKQGWMTYERQCHVQLELEKMVKGGDIAKKYDDAITADWNDVPKDKRPAVTA